MIPNTNEIRVEISTRCNYHCLMCPRDLLVRPRTDMPTPLFRKVIQKTISEAPQINTLTFSGFGEFSMDPGWIEKVKMASEHFRTIHVLTNLSRFSESDLFTLLKYVTTIRISLYGNTEKTYNQIHRPGSVEYFHIVNSNLSTLIRHKQNHQKIILNYLVMEENKQELDSWIRKWNGKADRIEVWKPHNWIDGKHYRNQCIHLLPTCGRPFNGPIQVQADGTLNVCCFDFNGKMVIGDLGNQTLSHIFNGNEITRVRNLHHRGEAHKLELCRICDQRMCNHCKSEFMLFSSEMSPEDRVAVTSTAFETLNLAT